MKKMIHSDFSGHTLFVSSIDTDAFPNFDSKDAYRQFYVVRNWDENGVIFMYLGKGHKDAPSQVVVWYRKGSFWSGYGMTIKEAVEGAQKDGWLYA